MTTSPIGGVKGTVCRHNSSVGDRGPVSNRGERGWGRGRAGVGSAGLVCAGGFVELVEPGEHHLVGVVHLCFGGCRLRRRGWLCFPLRGTDRGPGGRARAEGATDAGAVGGAAAEAPLRIVLQLAILTPQLSGQRAAAADVCMHTV